MKVSSSLLSLVGFFYGLSAYAFYPVDGWWYNPSQSGRGFQIEMQDDHMFVAAFHYTPDGQPIWWVADGKYDDATGRMTGEFLEFENGQCAGCPYLGRPDVVPGAGSPVTLEFDSPISGTLLWDGESIPIQRQYWRFALNQPNRFLFGEFHFTAGALGVYFGDRIYFDDTFTDSGGTDFVSGRVRGGSAERLALGRFDDDLGLFAVLLDSSDNFYKFFAFEMTKDRMEGQSWTFRKDEELTGSGLSFIAHRVASRTFVETGSGPNRVHHPEAHEVKLAGDTRDQFLQQLQEMAHGVSQHQRVGSGTDAGNEYLPAVELLKAQMINRDRAEK